MIAAERETVALRVAAFGSAVIVAPFGGRATRWRSSEGRASFFRVRRPEEIQVFVCRRSGAEFLALHRGPARGGYWHPAAGALEEGERAEQAAVRELGEEIGLDAAGRFWPVRYEYAYDAAGEPPERRAEWPPGTERIAVTGFIVEAPPDFEPTLDWEHDDYRWCSFNEAVALFYWPDVGEALEELWRRAG